MATGVMAVAPSSISAFLARAFFARAFVESVISHIPSL
jgi:hypothetical protein